jgi:hypothetical protein
MLHPPQRPCQNKSTVAWHLMRSLLSPSSLDVWKQWHADDAYCQLILFHAHSCQAFHLLTMSTIVKLLHQHAFWWLEVLGKDGNGVVSISIVMVEVNFFTRENFSLRVMLGFWQLVSQQGTRQNKAPAQLRNPCLLLFQRVAFLNKKHVLVESAVDLKSNSRSVKYHSLSFLLTTEWQIKATALVHGGRRRHIVFLQPPGLILHLGIVVIQRQVSLGNQFIAELV